MKFTKIKPYYLFALLAFIGCQDEDLIGETADNSYRIEEGNPCDFEIHGTYIDNGMSSPTSNNILVFPDEDSFFNTIDNLELQAEDYDDNFLNENEGLSEEELEDLEDDLNYDPDFPLIQYENSHEFHSLRTHYSALEEDWLEISDSDTWSWEEDPTNDAIVDGLEQTVYNQYYEVIVCNILYKLTENGIVYIPLDSPNVSEILGLINNGENPGDVISQLGGVTVNEENSSELNLPTPSLPVFQSNFSNNTQCISKERKIINFVHPYNNKKLVKAKQIIRSGPWNKLYKAVTRSYKKKGSKWKRRRTKISAGLRGSIHNKTIGCPSAKGLDIRNTIKNRRRREKTERISNNDIEYNIALFGANNSALKSRHFQDGVWHEIIFEH